jgi:hypothetical protein
MAAIKNLSVVDAISSANDTIALQKQKLVTLRKNHKRIDKITTGINLILSGAEDVKASVHIYPYSDGEVSITVTMRSLPSFKCKVLESVLEYCEAMNVGKASTSDMAQWLNRDYRFELADNWNLSVVAYVKADSNTCRKIKVGMEIVEQDKWEIQCD